MRQAETGFSVMEALVAMTVLAVASAGYLQTAQDTIRRASDVQDRIFLRWTAEDVMAERQAGANVTAGPRLVWGRRFDITQTQRAVENAPLQKLTLTLTEQESKAAISIDGYLRPEGLRR